SMTWNVLARLGRAKAGAAGVRLTPFYPKSAGSGQLRPRACSNAGRRLAAPSSLETTRLASRKSEPCRRKNEPCRWSNPLSRVEWQELLRGRRGAVLCLLLAVGAEFLALLAMQALGVGFLRAFERGGRMNHGLLVHFRGRGGGRRGRLCQRSGAHQQHGSKRGRDRAGRKGHHGGTSG